MMKLLLILQLNHEYMNVRVIDRGLLVITYVNNGIRSLEKLLLVIRSAQKHLRGEFSFNLHILDVMNNRV